MSWFKSKYKKVRVPLWIVHIIWKRGNLRFEWEDKKGMDDFLGNITNGDKDFFIYGNGAIRRSEIYKIEIVKDYRIKRVRKNLKEVIKKSGKKKS